MGNLHNAPDDLIVGECQTQAVAALSNCRNNAQPNGIHGMIEFPGEHVPVKCLNIRINDKKKLFLLWQVETACYVQNGEMGIL